MPKPTPQKRVLFVRTLILGVGVVLSVSFSLFLNTLLTSKVVLAASDTTINFQARLLTAGGGIVPDGSYNVEFKLYNASSSSGSSQGSCTGDSACLWTETRTGANVVVVKGGYLSVALGSVTAFPTTINWDQNLWLTMNIGGIGTPSWDGEMSPRLALNAVPYALRAGQLASLAGSNEATLQFASSFGQATSISLPDPGASSATICYQGASACGFATGSGTAFLQNGNSFGAAANLGTNDSNALNLLTGGVSRLTLSTSGSVTLNQASTISTSTGNLTIQANGTSTLALDTTGAGTVTLGASNATTVNVGNNSATVSINSGSTLGLGNNAVNKTVNVGATGSTANTTTINLGTSTGAAQTLNVGSSNSSSTATVQGGSGYLYAGGGGLGINTTNPQSGASLTITNASWLSALNSAGTGYINMFQVNSNNEIQVGAALNVDGGVIFPTDGGQLTFSDLPIDSSASSGTKESYTFRVGTGNVMTVYGEADGSGNLQNPRVAIGSSISPAYTLDVGGDINASGVIRTGTTQRIDASGNLSNIGTISASGPVTLGTSSSTTGAITFKGSGGTGTLTLQGPTTPNTGNFTLTIPTITANDTVCVATLANCTAIGSASGDLTGTYPGPTIAKLQGTTVSISSLATGNVFQYNGSNWVNAMITNSNLSSGTFSAITGTGALAAGSIASGFGTIATANTITGTTLNGTTGINTGAGAGTQRIDSSGNLVSIGNITGSGAVTLQSGGSNTNLSLQANGTGTVLLDSTGAGTVTIASTATTVTLGNGTSTSIGIGSNAAAHTINIGTGAAAQAVQLGSTNTTSTTVINGGTGASGATTINGTVLVKPIASNDSTTAFQIQNAAGTSFFTADSTNQIITTLDQNVGNPSTVGSAGRLFSDDFENGNLNVWSGGVAGTVTIDTAHVRSGKYAAKVVQSGSTSSSVYTNIGAVTSPTAFSFRGYFYATAAPSASANLVNFCYGPNCINTQINITRHSDDSLCIYVGAITTSYCSSAGAYTLNTWNRLELVATVNSTTGSVALYLNGNAVAGASASSINTGSAANGVTRFYVGDISGSSLTQTFWADDVAVDTTSSPLGSSSSLAINDSLHVAGTSTFSSNALFQSVSNSAAAFQVQNAASTTYLGIDTLNSIVNLGITGSTSQAETVNIGNTTNGNQTVSIGSLANTSATTIQGGTGNINLNVNQTGTGVVIKTATNNSLIAFQIQDSSSNALFNVDTVNDFVINNGTTTVGNLLQNPGFESNGASSNNGWQGTSLIINDPTNAHSGNYVEDISTASVSRATQEYYAVTPGQQIYLEGWVKTNGTGTGGLFIEWTDKNKSNANFTNGDWTNPGSTYTLKTITVTVPAGEAYMRVATTVRSGATGDWYFDDLYLAAASQQAPQLLQNSVNSTTAFQIENAAGTSLLNADTTTLTLTVNKLVVSNGLTISGHVISSGSAPTIAAGAAACTSPTVSVSGNDTAGSVTITTGTGCSSSGVLATITFNAAYASTPNIILTPRGNSSSLQWSNNSSSTTNFTVNTNNTPANSTVYSFNYLVVQ